MDKIDIFETNIFLNKELYYKHFHKKYRKQRLTDFLQIYHKLKKHLIPKDEAFINKKKMNKYIELHKKENREYLEDLLQNVVSVPFKQFYHSLIKMIDRFNKKKIKKYIFVIGVGNNAGANITNFNIFKSNLWIFMLIYKYLKIKPYDIMLNLNTSIRLYNPTIIDYLLMDDCSYSGDQIVNRVLYVAGTELLFNEKKDDITFLIHNVLQKTMIPVTQNKKINVHLVIPYISKTAYEKICNISLMTQLNVITYVRYVINPYNNILDENKIKKINKLYQKFYPRMDIGQLIPIFFGHKIADSVSTIDLILIKGQILDNPKLKYVFIDECQYNKKNSTKQAFNPEEKGFIYKKIYCPIPPYVKFIQLLKK